MRHSKTSRTREALPASSTREMEAGASRSRSAERPASIKDAIVRWLNEEL